MTKTIDDYLGLVAAQHRTQPNYIAALTAILQPLVDMYNSAASLNTLFDLDSAVGQQLDMVGLWIGTTRTLPYPIENVYFSWDVEGVGWNEGLWWQTGESMTSLVSLPDDQYRFLLKAKVAINFWDGSIADAIDIWGIMFGGTYAIDLVDNQDMTMDVIIAGKPLDAVSKALLYFGEIAMRPSGVRVKRIISSSDIGPIFGLGLDNPLISGLGIGAIVTTYTGEV